MTSSQFNKQIQCCDFLVLLLSEPHFQSNSCPAFFLCIYFGSVGNRFTYLILDWLLPCIRFLFRLNLLFSFLFNVNLGLGWSVYKWKPFHAFCIKSGNKCDEAELLHSKVDFPITACSKELFLLHTISSTLTLLSHHPLFSYLVFKAMP